MSTENKPSDHFKIKVGLGPDGGLWNPKFSTEQFPIQERWLVNIEAFEQLKAELQTYQKLSAEQTAKLIIAKGEIQQLKSKLAKLEEICRGIRRNYVGPDNREKAMLAVNDLDEYLKGVK